MVADFVGTGFRGVLNKMKYETGSGPTLSLVTLNIPAALPFSQYSLGKAGNFIEYLSGTSGATLTVQTSSGEKFLLTPGKWYKFDNPSDSFNISGFAASDVLVFNVGFAITGPTPEKSGGVIVPPSPNLPYNFFAETLSAGQDIGPITPPVDYKYLILNMSGTKGQPFQLYVFDAESRVITGPDGVSPVPIYHADGTPFNVPTNIGGQLSYVLGANNETIVVPLYGCTVYGLSGVAINNTSQTNSMSFEGQFTNNWN